LPPPASPGKARCCSWTPKPPRARLKSNPWIADATILKLYPDRLHIAITERQAFAMWQKDNRVTVIGSDGTVVQPFVDARFANLPLVVGAGAEKAASDFLALTDRFPPRCAIRCAPM
jgi:cell division protein FtsQ